MVQFTIKTDTPAKAITTGRGSASAGKTMSDLHTYVQARTDIASSTKNSYLGAIEYLADVLNKPLITIDACLDEFDERFPKTAFDIEQWPTNTAFGLWRRRVRSPLRKFLGVTKALADLRMQQDEWNDLFDAIEPLVSGKVGQSARWHPMKLSALKTFAVVARAYGYLPRDIGIAVALRLDSDFTGNKREANRRSIDRLDELRQFPEILPLLPPQAVNFKPELRRKAVASLDHDWEAQFCGWIEKVTKTGWDPVSRQFADDHQSHADVMRSAMRTFLRIAVDTGRVSNADADLEVVLEDDDLVTEIAGELLERTTRRKCEGRLVPRTCRKYLKAIGQIRRHLGIDNSELELIIANNAISREGGKAEKRMTKKNRQFCEALIDKPHVRRRFFFSFETLKQEASSIFEKASLERRDLTRREIGTARLLGSAACFVAIEIGGAPIRIENAMGLTCFGDDAQLRVPKGKDKPIQLWIPPELTKNREEIEFPIQYDKFGYYETIRWYLKEIRPLFPHADSGPYLFPAVKTPGASMNPSWFGSEFSNVMRTYVDLPMTPHQMRHGQVSLLLNKHPEEIEVIAKRIDDKAATMRTFYGFIKALLMVERGQDLLKGLIDV
ncbi:hypothetical protein N5A93_08265 [Roseovarius sp. EGI FJ00037]|uniref:hypothetical protein n=1 Tax=Roseovarius salincola TaxID=2978479 RepID=UPI0022A883E5|nr:hypothetical protein [Roseovarius sp. EGI FJ00037]MCZ0812222.1 hypothetical protein [Roseovarius sp. EGI FJ00037]